MAAIEMPQLIRNIPLQAISAPISCISQNCHFMPVIVMDAPTRIIALLELAQHPAKYIRCICFALNNLFFGIVNIAAPATKPSKTICQINSPLVAEL